MITNVNAYIIENQITITYFIIRLIIDSSMRNIEMF